VAANFGAEPVDLPLPAAWVPAGAADQPRVLAAWPDAEPPKTGDGLLRLPGRAAAVVRWEA
jgi:hypothetical protein